MAKVFVAYVSVQPIRCPDSGLFHLTHPFPIDMLRYDGLHPKTESDSAVIASTIDRTGGNDYDSRDFPIVLTRHVDSKLWQPERERWESFGWMVTNCKVEVH